MIYDAAITGGGLAGLALAIDLSKRGYRVVVAEKNGYPRHKVCGEYISNESKSYLYSLCPELAKLNLPQIRHFKLTSTGSHEFKIPLDLGGFGISRYLLEEMLYHTAVKQGVEFRLQSKVMATTYNTSTGAGTIEIQNGEKIEAKLVLNASGMKSGLSDKIAKLNWKTPNYIGVKYHVSIERDASLIEIHNFPGGYCGISTVENKTCCLCYLVNAEKLRQAGNNIREMEKRFLYQNNHLKFIFENCDFLFENPVTKSGIHFSVSKDVFDNIYYLGDAAGSIAPVTGNGMSNALRSAWFLGLQGDRYLSEQISKSQLDSHYTAFRRKEFSSRIKISRYLQKLSEYPYLTKNLIRLFHLIPFIAKNLIRLSHGRPF